MTFAGAVGIVHVHSTYSSDGKDTLEQLVDQALRRRIDFVCLGDHAEDLETSRFESYVEHCKRASARGVRIIPGLEYRFAGYPGLHIVAIGLRDWIVADTPEAFMHSASRAAALTMLAHPLLAGYKVPDAVRSHIDAVEVWNARYDTRYLPDPGAINLLRVLRATRPSVVAIAGLDQHDGRNDREARVLTSGGVDDALEDLSAGRFRNAGRLVSFDSAASFTPISFLTLRLSRLLLDQANQVHDRLVRLGRRNWRR